MKEQLSIPALKRAVLDLCSMIDGLDIAIERGKELREAWLFNYVPFESSEQLTFSLDVLLGRLQKDRKELKEAKFRAQTALWDAMK